MLSFSRARRAAILAGGAKAFTPASISGLVAWYDFSDAATLFTDAARTTAVTADGDTIRGVTDKSGNAVHLAQATSTKAPLYKVNIKNGRSVSRFDGTDDYINALFGANKSQPNTIYAVLNVRNVVNGDIFIDGSAAQRNAIFTFSTNKWTLYAGSVPTTTQVITAGWHLARALFNGASSALSIDGGADETQSAGTSAMGGVHIASDASSVANGTAEIDVAELIVYNASVTGSNDSAIKAYLNTKWAVY